MNSLDYIVKKYSLNIEGKLPIEIPNTDRNDLAKLFAELKYEVGAEIGVKEGIYSEILCKANPSLRLYCIDPWLAYKGYDTKQLKYDRYLDEAKKRLEPYNCLLIKKFSMDAVKACKDNSLDFVYIDGNHDLKNVVCDLVEWTKKVRFGGMVSGHDYCRRAHFRFIGKSRMKNMTHHVVEAVNAFTAAYYVNPWFVFGRRKKISGEIRDNDRSWMFIKQW